MQPILITQLVVLVVVANGAALAGKKIFGETFAWPLDGGAMLRDGRPLFGPTKTVRGIVLAVLVTPVAAVLVGLEWQLGLVVAVAAMAGDLVSSFLKRRLAYPPSNKAAGLDHVPESLFPLAASRLLVPITLLDIVAGVALFVIGALALSRLLFRLGVRDEPH